MSWAMSQPVDKSSAKFVLVAMANCVNGDGREMLCWPSTQHLADATAQDRKTVLDNMRRLRDAGFIEDTKERKGATGQIAVYRLKTPEIGTVKSVAPTPARAPEPISSSTKSGTVDPAESKAETVPNFPINSPGFPYEQSRISLLTVPKTGHGTSKEPVRNKEGTRKRAAPFDAGSVDLPEWLERDCWQRWVKDRKARNKPITEDAARLQIAKLAGYEREGFPACEVIDHSIASSYQGLFPPKRTPAKTAGKHAGFRNLDYTEGVTNGTPDA
jgi:hypothetical protein